MCLEVREDDVLLHVVVVDRWIDFFLLLFVYKLLWDIPKYLCFFSTCSFSFFATESEEKIKKRKKETRTKKKK